MCITIILGFDLNSQPLETSKSMVDGLQQPEYAEICGFYYYGSYYGKGFLYFYFNFW